MDYKSIKEFNNASSQTVPEVTMDEKSKEIEKFAKGRIDNMQAYRKDLKIEDKWKEADREYEPREIDFGNKKKRFESDDEQGLRSRLVPIKDETNDWRSRNSDPTLLVKIQTALAILLDTNPEAMFTVLNKKYENKTALAYSLWKRNWNITDAKEVYKLFTFDDAKYGWAVGKTFPQKIAYEKEVLTEVNEEDPSKNVYEMKTNVWFNDINRKRLNPFRTWIDEQTKPYNDYSTNDWYYEEDYSYDAAMVEFGKYPEFKKLVPFPRDLRMSYEEDGQVGVDDEKKERTDIITIGFYENRLKDLYAIRIPKLEATIHFCPLPNDDGMLSLWHTPWILRSADHPYGISLWEIIKQKKGLYDKMQNMTMDQLVLSIMKMFFYTGTNNLVGDGKIKIVPGKGVQIINGKIDWMDVPGPDQNAWVGLSNLKKGMDDDSGITPTLQGETKGQTLGQDMISKEASLKRLKTPVDNIADAIEQDAYITLSWMAQIYSTPEIKAFETLDEIKAYELESGQPSNTIMASSMDEQGAPQGPFGATFYPQLNLKLEKQGDKLVESTKDQFFQVNKDIPAGDLKWRGILKVIPKSIVGSSSELEKQRKMEVFNIMAPLLPQPPQLFAKPVKQLLTINEENPQDWLPESWLKFLEQDQQNLFLPAAAPAAPEEGAGDGMGQGVPSNQTSMQGAEGTTPGASAPTVVPTSQIPTPTLPGVNAAPRTELTRAAQ